MGFILVSFIEGYAHLCCSVTLCLKRVLFFLSASSVFFCFPVCRYVSPSLSGLCPLDRLYVCASCGGPSPPDEFHSMGTKVSWGTMLVKPSHGALNLPAAHRDRPSPLPIRAESRPTQSPYHNRKPKPMGPSKSAALRHFM